MLHANAKLRRFSVLYRLPAELSSQRVEIEDFTVTGALLKLPTAAQVLEIKEIPFVKHPRKEAPGNGRK